MAYIKINDVIYGSNNASDIIYKNTTVEEKLNAMPIFDLSDNINIENAKYDYLTYGHIINGLNSDATDKVLSAKQGKTLNEKINNLDSDIELLNNSLNNEYISNCDVFEEIEKEVVKRGDMSTFCLSFGEGLINAPTSDWIWFSIIYKAARIIAFNKDSIAILHRDNGINKNWQIINPLELNNTVRYNSSTNKLDIYSNGIIIGSINTGICGSALIPTISAMDNRIIYSSVFDDGTDYPPWKAFNKGANTDYSDSWYSADGKVANEYLGWNFGEYKTLDSFDICTRNYTNPMAPKAFKLQGSDDGVNWYDIESYLNTTSDANVWIHFTVSHPNRFKMFRIYILSSYDTSNRAVSIAELQFYGN